MLFFLFPGISCILHDLTFPLEVRTEYSMPTKPSPDKELFKNCPEEVRQLAKQSRQELRQEARRRFAESNGMRTAKTPLR